MAHLQNNSLYTLYTYRLNIAHTYIETENTVEKYSIRHIKTMYKNTFQMEAENHNSIHISPSNT